MGFSLNNELVDKIGNAMIFLSQNTNSEKLSKTKLLKLLYILDETSVKKTGFPMFNLDYRVWKYGPVDTEIYAELNRPHLLSPYISQDIYTDRSFTHIYIKAINEFSDDEFSEGEIDTMSLVCKKFYEYSGTDLVAITHRENSPWHNKALEYDVLGELNRENLSTTDIKINLSEVIEHDDVKTEVFKEYLEIYGVR